MNFKIRMIMKKLVISTILCALVATEAAAQVKAYKAGERSDESNAVAYALPRSVVKVRVVTEKESVRVGPYARFAQKLLGVMAPLADKDVYTIKSATLATATEADPSEIYALDNPDKSPLRIYDVTPEGLIAMTPEGMAAVPSAFAACPAEPCRNEAGLCRVVSHVGSDTSFVKFAVDRRSLAEKSPESMAMDAANAIFSLRKHRFDLVTGEAGENVFGDGLKAALDEIDRLEQEYLALFLGKQFRRTVVREYEVVPSADDTNVIVCRFSDNGGLLPSTDLSGRPVVLELTPEKKAQSAVLNRKKEARGTIYYKIADVVNCRLLDGNREIAQGRLPLYQFGVTAEMPVPSAK